MVTDVIAKVCMPQVFFACDFIVFFAQFQIRNTCYEYLSQHEAIPSRDESGNMMKTPVKNQETVMYNN